MLWTVLALLLLYALIPARGDAASLKVLTINVWSGLDYIGTLKMGEYETAERRELRFRSLVTQVKDLSPDVIFIQEANPVGKYAARLAEALSMEEIHQVVNAGIRVGSLGMPVNLREGLAILAKPGLSLRKTAAWKLSGPPGIHSDIVSFLLSEVVLALVGKLTVEGEDVYLVNVHLAASPRKPADMSVIRDQVLSRGILDEAGYEQVLLKWNGRQERRKKEVEKLVKFLKSLPSETLCLAAGDFNAEPDSGEMKAFAQQTGFVDALDINMEKGSASGEQFTWDVFQNANTSFSASTRDASGLLRRGYDHVCALAGFRNRRLDYIFLGESGSGAGVKSASIVLKKKVGGLQVSDHFGIVAEIDLPR